uniref:Putative secreted protein n=1 Tax=Ixodes ricinus TaxID=34613 RepID=A0A6B0U3B4_IXORI
MRRRWERGGKGKAPFLVALSSARLLGQCSVRLDSSVFLAARLHSRHASPPCSYSRLQFTIGGATSFQRWPV